jgi:hypothetical protein
LSATKFAAKKRKKERKKEYQLDQNSQIWQESNEQKRSKLSERGGKKEAPFFHFFEISLSLP